MTTYGTGRTNVQFTGYSPTLGPTVVPSGSVYDNPGTTGGSVTFNGFTQQDRRVNSMMRRGWGIKLSAMMQTLIGSVGGTGAIQQRLWVGGSSVNPPPPGVPPDNFGSGAQGGGLVRIENTAPLPLNRTLNANDITDLKTLVSFTGILGPDVSVDRSGNGYAGGFMPSKAGW